MSRKSYPNVNAANQYARNVVRGKIPACQFVIQACQRHIDDMAAEKSKKFRYRFDKDMAEKAAKFIQLLPHTKGEWAFKRMPITLEAWQLFIVCCAFGWVQKGSKLRRFREVYTEIPRKNGKSAISAGVALYCFTCDNEFGAEVYSGATTEKQAWEVFRPARLMCKRTPLLVEAFGIEVNASNLNRPEDGARFEPLIGNPGDGASPHCAIVDEYHEHPTDSLYTTMLTGMGARRQPLMWAITTAGYNIEGPCYDKRREVIEMLNGTVPNEELFGVIYTVDEGDDWTDPKVLEKANPNTVAVTAHPAPDCVTVSQLPDGVAEYSVWGLKLPDLRQRLFRCVAIRENDDGTYAITAVQHVPEKGSIVDNGATFDPLKNIQRLTVRLNLQSLMSFCRSLHVRTIMRSMAGEFTVNLNPESMVLSPLLL